MDLPEKMIRDAGCALGHEHHDDMEFGEMARVVLSSAGVPKLLEALRMALGRMLFNRQSAHECAVIESTGVIPTQRIANTSRNWTRRSARSALCSPATE